MISLLEKTQAAVAVVMVFAAIALMVLVARGDILVGWLYFALGIAGLGLFMAGKVAMGRYTIRS